MPAKLASGLAVAAVVSLALSGPGTRWGWWGFRTGLLLFALGAVLGLLAAILGLAAGRRARRRSIERRLAGMAVVIGLTAMLLPTWGIVSGRRLPRIHDVTTDLADPPQFRAALAKRGADSNPTPAVFDPDHAAQHRKGYPDLQPLIVPDPAPQALARSAGTARSMGWEVHAVHERDGLIEATATTPWFGFRDDIAIRVRPEGSGSRIDLRSTSRVGRSDLGANAARIRRFQRLMRR